MTTFFEDEIRSQADVLRSLREEGARQAQRVVQSWRDITYAVVGARGSSDNAALVLLGQVLALRLGELRGRPIDNSPGLGTITRGV